MTAQDVTHPVRLPRRSRQGVVMGMDVWQLTCLAVAAVILLIGVNRFGPPGLLYAAPAYLPIGVFAFITIHGDSAPHQVGIWLMKQLRHAMGATTQVYRPERSHVAGTLNLPGIRASVQLWDVDGVACVYNPHDRSVSVTAEVEVQGFLMKDITERYDLSQQWAPVLASFTQRPGIKRAVLQERTIPTTIRAARASYDAAVERHRLDPESPIGRNYSDVMDASEPFAVSHRNYLTFTLDLIALGPQLKALGGGDTAVKALARLEARNLADALSAARISVRSWLTVRDVASLARLGFDPEFAANVQNREDDRSGVDPIAIGPMYLEEPRGRNGIVYTDSAVHTTMWIHEWPRSETAVGFVEPLVFARTPSTGEAITHIFSIVLTPVSVKKALHRIEDDKKIWRGNEKLRAKRGVDGSAADAADWEGLERQEEEIVAGHGEFRYGAYLTVSAHDEEKLDQAIAGMRNALARAGMEPQILYCQQAEALMVNALPIGLGMN
ncbi:MAG: SCO6880 family protein [Microbacterium sp.]|uniref:SCO6880 family protein n=1 Tax=Microbacterium sp. TaxID=51671 RepID=UPI003F7D742D